MKVLYATILDLMLEALDYWFLVMNRKFMQIKECVTITFNTSMLLFEVTLVPKSIYGICSIR